MNLNPPPSASFIRVVIIIFCMCHREYVSHTAREESVSISLLVFVKTMRESSSYPACYVHMISHLSSPPAGWWCCFFFVVFLLLLFICSGRNSIKLFASLCTHLMQIWTSQACDVCHPPSHSLSSSHPLWNQFLSTCTSPAIASVLCVHSPVGGAMSAVCQCYGGRNWKLWRKFPCVVSQPRRSRLKKTKETIKKVHNNNNKRRRKNEESG